MESISVPPEFGQGWYRDSWDLALRSGGSPHSPHEVRPPHPLGGAATVKHAAGDYKLNADEEFKKHVVAMLMQRDVEMRLMMHQSEQLHLKMEAVTIELVKTNAALHEERRWREEMMSVMVAKEKVEKDERTRREVEETKRKGEQAWSQHEEVKRLHETIARLEQGQQALRDHVERKYDEEEERRRAEEHKKAEWLTRERLENEKDEMEKRNDEETEVHTDAFASGLQTPSDRTKTPSSRGSGGLTCYNCHQDGHYAKDCVDVDLECELCGGMGHSAANCIPSKRCYNCNKTGHRHFECKEQGTRRCFHCRKVGHLAINCKNAPKQ